MGEWAADFDADLAWAASEGKAIEPLTSIAWLFWHVGSVPARTAELDFFGGDHEAESGWTSPYIAEHPIFTTADEAVAAMRAGWRALEAALRSATDEQLERPTRFWGYGGPGPMGTGAQVTGAALNEVSHHGTQMGVLRDLYRLPRRRLDRAPRLTSWRLPRAIGSTCRLRPWISTCACGSKPG